MGRTAVDWIVQRDPSDTFTARLFNLTTIRQSARDGAWPEGIVFYHPRSAQQLVYRQGQLVAAAQRTAGQVHHA